MSLMHRVLLIAGCFCLPTPYIVPGAMLAFSRHLCTKCCLKEHPDLRHKGLQGLETKVSFKTNCFIDEQVK